VRAQLPEIPARNIVGEPQGRDSAPAIGLMAALLEKTLGPDAVMVVLPADHVILKPEHFADVLRAAADVALKDYLVTVGIEPTGPDTGFGYIQRGEPIADGAIPAYAVRQFKEKPKQDIAEGYLAEGGYSWNAGMFIVRVGALRDLYRKYVPDMEEAFATLVAAIQSGDQATVEGVFPTLRKISFDYAVAEHADRVAVIPAEIGWSDVGSWARLAEVLAHQQGEDGNIVVGKHVGVDTRGSLVYSPKRLIATIGLEDIIVIDTPDAVLICPKSRSEDVKQVVDALRERGEQHLL
jgi:mannose-1-phosphate guanylyltransferase